jgi:hypothetical protein
MGEGQKAGDDGEEDEECGQMAGLQPPQTEDEGQGDEEEGQDGG